jgi:dipeptidyl aminopeptidase/acylaminoacyl peptidase
MFSLSPIKYSLLLTLLAASQIIAQTGRPLELADMFRMYRVAEPALSPDGQWIICSVGLPDLTANKVRYDLYLISTDGKETRQLTSDPANERSAAWSPDGKWIAFISTRSGEPQIWVMTPDGKDMRQVTTLSTGASAPVWSPDGKSIAFVSEVFPEFSSLSFSESDSLNKRRLDEMENGKVKARIFTRLMYRHWDHWVDGKRQHIFVQPFPAGEPRDLTPGDRDAVPTSPTFSGGIDFAFSPDGREIAYTATPVPVEHEAWSTNHDIYTVPVTGGTPKQLTTNLAADGYPRYSPDGRYIAYRAQSRPGFEADRWQLILLDRVTGATKSLTSRFDSHVAEPVWSTDSKGLYFVAEEAGNEPIFFVTTQGNDVRKILSTNSNSNLEISRDGKMLTFTTVSAIRPPEIFGMNVDGTALHQISRMNDDQFSRLDLPAPENIWYKGATGTKVQAWLFKPPKFDPSKKYPFVLLVHGGPQGAWGNSWSYRWNPPLWAAQGYVVMAPNPRGSTGFGQKFIDQISGDWGGKVFVDLMKGVDYACSLPYVDTTRKAAAGASFGGYMMNWFQGHTTRFKTLITHDGVYNFESMYATTDEVWFDEWEHGGTPWDKPKEYAKFSPHRYARNFKTPNLVIHGALDFRIPDAEAMQLFTTLQRKGIPSKFLYFPDEGHWVLKPLNSQLWHRTVFDWLTEYLK